MSYRLFSICLLSGGLLVSCQSSQHGSRETDMLADNGGYTYGSFYGDSSAPVPAGYPRDGQSFATNGGVPFGHNDPILVEDPVVDPIPIASAPVPMVAATAPAAPVERVETRVMRADSYGQAYAPAGSYGGNAGAERAVVTPYVERTEPARVAGATTQPESTKMASSKPRSPQAGGGSTKKPAAVAATSGRTTTPGRSKAGSVGTGTTVKTIYNPPGKGGATKKKKANLVRVHDIKRGDTLTKLANRYGVTVAQLKTRNKLASDTIVVGKRLTID